MTLLISLLVALGLAWGLAYRGASLALWSGTLVAYLLALAAVDVLGGGGLLLALILAVPLLAVLNVTRWRRQLITARVFEPFRRALPPMTQTEQEALEAGDVWWEADLFRGRPDWQRLLDLRISRLSTEEQAFLDDQVERLCAMLDEDQIVRQDHDLAPEVW